jgi:hypothetical protein
MLVTSLRLFCLAIAVLAVAAIVSLALAVLAVAAIVFLALAP